MLRNFIKRLATIISNFFVKWAEGILAAKYKCHRAFVGVALTRHVRIENANLESLVETIISHTGTDLDRNASNASHIRDILNLPEVGEWGRDNIDRCGIEPAICLFNASKNVINASAAIKLFILMAEMSSMVEELMKTKHNLDWDAMRHFFTSKNANTTLTEMVLAYGKCLVENHPNYKPRKKREARAAEPVQEVEPIAIPEFNVEKAIAEAVDAVTAVEDEPVIHARPEGGYHLSHEGVIQIREYIKAHPEMTYTEIGKLFNISQVAVSKHAIAIGVKRK